jgi:quercetin dioxygenase-like cupin family protein
MQVASKEPSSEPLTDRRHSILCLCGQVELELDGQAYSLNPGDSLAFNSDAFHRWRNTGNETGITVLVLPPTSFQELETGNEDDNTLG